MSYSFRSFGPFRSFSSFMSFRSFWVLRSHARVVRMSSWQSLWLLCGRPDDEFARRVIDRTRDRFDPALFVSRSQQQPTYITTANDRWTNVVDVSFKIRLGRLTSKTFKFEFCIKQHHSGFHFILMTTSPKCFQ